MIEFQLQQMPHVGLLLLPVIRIHVDCNLTFLGKTEGCIEFLLDGYEISLCV